MFITIKLVHVSFTAHNHYFVLVRVRILKLYCQSNCQIQGPAEVTPRVWLREDVNVLHKMDSSLNISPTMSRGGLEYDIVMLQSYMLTTL